MNTNETFGSNTIELPGNTMIPSVPQSKVALSSTSCPVAIFATFGITLINASINSNNISGIRDFVVPPGNNIAINYLVKRTDNNLQIKFAAGTPAQQINDTINQTIKGFRLKQPLSVTFNKTSMIATLSNRNPIFVNNTVDFIAIKNGTTSQQDSLAGVGIQVYVTPGHEITAFNAISTTVYPVALHIVTFPNAQQETYSVTLGPSFCGGAPFLLTVGSKPYNLSVTA